MKQNYVLRHADDAACELRFTLHPHNRIESGSAEPILVVMLRRDDCGFVTVLFGERVVCGFIDKHNGTVTLTLDGRPQKFSLRPAAVDTMHQGLLNSNHNSGPINVRCPIPGTIKAILIQVGASVAAGQTLAILEAMKMENEIRATRAGTVETVHAINGQNVAAETLLFTIKG